MIGEIVEDVGELSNNSDRSRKSSAWVRAKNESKD